MTPEQIQARLDNLEALYKELSRSKTKTEKATHFCIKMRGELDMEGSLKTPNDKHYRNDYHMELYNLSIKEWERYKRAAQRLPHRPHKKLFRDFVEDFQFIVLHGIGLYKRAAEAATSKKKR